MINKLQTDKKDIYDLIEIIETLRGESGCPWDREQTHESIKKGMIEESYEVMDAIDKGDENGIIEELGDVLLQVVFHCVLGKEEGRYDLGDVIEGICNKMIYRHPHVFGEDKLKNTEEVLVKWDELKKIEKNLETTSDELKGVARALPALIRAKKVQSKASKVGFDWDSVEGAAEKVEEELKEVLDVYKSKNRAMITEEVGDLLFSCVNISRFLDVDPEEALKISTDKFIRRFSGVEENAGNRGLNLKEMTLEEMNILWKEIKKLEK
jgi:tetrapyrrole methylase family protein/MazG family protein